MLWLSDRGRGAEIQFSPAGRWLAAGYADHTISLWNLQQSNIDDSMTLLHGHTGNVVSLDFSDDDTYLVSAAISDRNVLAWNLQDEVREESDDTIRPVILRGHSIGLRTAEFISAGRIVSRDEEGILRLWQPDDYQTLSFPAVRRVHAHRTNAIDFDGQGNIVSSSNNRIIARWRTDQPATTPLQQWKCDATANSIDVSPNGRLLAAGLTNGEVQLFTPGDKFEIGEPTVLSGVEKPTRCVRFDATGERLAACSDNGDIRIWSVADLSAEPTILKCKSQRTWSLAFSPDGTTLATAHQERKVRVWNLQQPEAAPQVLSEHSDDVRDVAFRFDGQQLASSSHDKTIRLWSKNAAGEFELSHLLRGHVERVIDIDYSPDGKQLASAGFDKTVLLWNLTVEIPSRSVSAIRHFNNEVVAVEYSHDGKRLATATKIGETLIWTVDVTQLLAEAKRKAGRDFNSTEEEKYTQGHID